MLRGHQLLPSATWSTFVFVGQMEIFGLGGLNEYRETVDKSLMRVGYILTNYHRPLNNLNNFVELKYEMT